MAQEVAGDGSEKKKLPKNGHVGLLCIHSYTYIQIYIWYIFVSVADKANGITRKREGTVSGQTIV